MNKGIIAAVVLAAGFGAVIYFAGPPGPKPLPSRQGAPAAAAPAAAASAPAGKALFQANCVKCHGEGAAGNDKGPPLVHRYYVPGHHADQAFLLAVRRGVRQHHWRFGNMEPIPGLSDAEVVLITRYVRGLQRTAGIF